MDNVISALIGYFVFWLILTLADGISNTTIFKRFKKKLLSNTTNWRNK